MNPEDYQPVARAGYPGIQVHGHAFRPVDIDAEACLMQEALSRVGELSVWVEHTELIHDGRFRCRFLGLGLLRRDQGIHHEREENCNYQQRGERAEPDSPIGLSNAPSST